MKCCPGADRSNLLAGALLLGSLACVAPAEAAGPPAGGAPPAEAPASAKTVSGNLLTRYRMRFTNDEDDHDLYETVDLAVADPEQRWQASVLARAALDVDGRDAGEDQDFFSLLDTYEHRFEPQLFHAYVDFRQEDFSLLRLGRQPLYETPLTVLFDGVRAELPAMGERRVELGAYAGVGEHLYEASSQGDAVLGAFGSARAWEGAELRADWMHLEDERLGVDHQNDLLGLVLNQELARESSYSHLDARFTSLEGNGRDLRLSASHVDDGARYSVQGSIYKLLQTQKSLAAPLDPFSATLFELFPYYQFALSASKDWTHFALLSGADLRRVEERDDVGDFNRDFERYYLTGTLPDLLPVSVSATGELWHATDTDFQTWGASLQRELDGELDASLGSYFALYKYDLSSSEERDHVRTYYLDLHWKPVRTRRWTLRYEFEQNDFDHFHQLRLDYSWTF